MTNADRRRALSAAGVTIRKTEDGDYRVAYAGKSERYAAYETDLGAALDTGEHMAANRPTELKPDLRIHRS